MAAVKRTRCLTTTKFDHTQTTLSFSISVFLVEASLSLYLPPSLSKRQLVLVPHISPLHSLFPSCARAWAHIMARARATNCRPVAGAASAARADLDSLSTSRVRARACGRLPGEARDCPYAWTAATRH